MLELGDFGTKKTAKKSHGDYDHVRLLIFYDVLKRNRGKNKKQPINLPCPIDVANAPFTAERLSQICSVGYYGYGPCWLRGNHFLPTLRALPMANASSYRLRLLLEYCTILLWSWNHSNSKE